jgi:hypothetical protein
MLGIAALLMLALAVVYTHSRGRFHGQQCLSEPHDGIVRIGIQIICGDCSGDADRPIKTYLDLHGNCARCGGRSYMLASNLNASAMQLATACLSKRESTMGDAFPKPVGAPTSLHAVRFRGLTT